MITTKIQHKERIQSLQNSTKFNVVKNRNNLKIEKKQTMLQKTKYFMSHNSRKITVLLITFILLFGASYFVFQNQTKFFDLNTTRFKTFSGMIFIYLSAILIVFKLSFFLLNIYLYFRYRTIKSVSDDELLSCTVIVPAYNEGKQVYDTLMSLAASDYPTEKIQIIGIDDGSKDDTWLWMKKAKEELGACISIFQQPENKGKRHALYRGFNLGSGDVFITVDSDSVVKKDTIRNMVSPFVVNKKCGAVAGNVLVLNNKQALIPKMLNVSFAFSFEFVRSAESELNSVLCTPGALSAYRREAVFACLESWINQTFMGQPSDIGEDRAMTNMILKQGYHVKFQRNAYVLTNVPESYKGLYKMFIRWGRSNVRENIMMSQFITTNFRQESKIGIRLLFVNQWIKLLMAYPIILFMIGFIFTHPMLFLSSTLLSILVLSSIPVLFYAKRHNFSEAIWAYSYGILYAFGLFWITPYAIATANRSGWLTRELQV
jgi:hyaluronan synthase